MKKQSTQKLKAFSFLTLLAITGLAQAQSNNATDTYTQIMKTTAERALGKITASYEACPNYPNLNKDISGDCIKGIMYQASDTIMALYHARGLSIDQVNQLNQLLKMDYCAYRPNLPDKPIDRDCVLKNARKIEDLVRQ